MVTVPRLLIITEIDIVLGRRFVLKIVTVLEMVTSLFIVIILGMVSILWMVTVAATVKS